MPIKYNLTKYDLLSTKIKKIAGKKGIGEMTKEEYRTMLKAVIVASFASGHSWKTYKITTSSGGHEFNNPEIKEEHQQAYVSKWKTVSPFDIGEISETNISDHAFSTWLFFNVDKSEHDDYKNAWNELQQELAEDCDGEQTVKEQIK